MHVIYWLNIMCTNICRTYFTYSPMFENCFICIIIYIHIFLQLWCTHSWGLRGRVVKVADLRSQVPHRCRFDPHSGRNLSCEEAIQLAYRRSVVLPRCPLVPEIIPEGAPGVFLHQLKLEKFRRKNLGGTL
jgi:hypothetical protein